MLGTRFLWPGGRFGLSVDAFSVASSERVFLHGPSGSGKSTLLSLISGIVAPVAGEIRLQDHALTGQRPAVRDRLRAEQTGVIFQMFNLVPYLTPLDNILLPLRFAPDRRKRCLDAKQAALDLTRALDLPDAAVLSSPASALSVGQQQRVAVARAMIGHPPLIIADEPTSALDMDARAAFMDLLFKQTDTSGAALLMVSHDLSLSDRFDRAIALNDIAQPLHGNAA
ncbi:MAG: ATP-binding cassette domain-containing protein [Paracoccaceae bacterium]